MQKKYNEWVRLTLFANLYQKKWNAPEKFHFTAPNQKTPVKPGFFIHSSEARIYLLTSIQIPLQGPLGPPAAKGLKGAAGPAGASISAATSLTHRESSSL